MAARWRAIDGFDGYEVSDNGRVRSVDREVVRSDGLTSRWRGRELRPKRHRDGHLEVNLHVGGKVRTVKVHRLVLTAFVGPCPPGHMGLHRNDVASDNRVANLYWGTSTENHRDSVRNGGHHYSRRDRCKHGHLFTPENTGYRAGGSRVCRQCKRDSYHRSRVSSL